MSSVKLEDDLQLGSITFPLHFFVNILSGKSHNPFGT